uniref:Uncharacterized protein n=1 Tax=Picea glauca TaxID=3330 RepID=A0A117NIK9_PICGL|nr:hypothetical protein ABT39_MTgene3318 [Picea glauca]
MALEEQRKKEEEDKKRQADLENKHLRINRGKIKWLETERLPEKQKKRLLPRELKKLKL